MIEVLFGESEAGSMKIVKGSVSDRNDPGIKSDWNRRLVVYKKDRQPDPTGKDQSYRRLRK